MPNTSLEEDNSGHVPETTEEVTGAERSRRGQPSKAGEGGKSTPETEFERVPEPTQRERQTSTSQPEGTRTSGHGGVGGAGGGAALLLGLYALLYYNFVAATRCRNAVSLRGKTVLITGGNSGIGKATAVDLARRGARVILACRDKVRGESAMYDIRRESGNSEVILMILDLGSLNSVRAFAQNFLKSEPRLDILINNAGILKDGQTADGFDRAFQVNHLGHFLLTHLLLDRLKHCAPSRIIIVSSFSHIFGKIDFHSTNKPNKWMMEGTESYFNSKLANVLHVRELAKRLKGTNVTCYAVDPGAVKTEINRSFPWWIFSSLWFMRLFVRDCDAGAQTSIYCATEEGIERLSGRYFVDCQPNVPSPQARDDQLAKKLWEFSERLLGLTA
ncbi:dehydrogenase/reductase SDR family member 13-like [Pantherophis guttatus]|uniref:Dehydrogenase/reductase SDR family member 13-like n=1 Tax=Pantherophis guttatus TaxID=94885 RepID=A0ABM3YQ90_PANGU|nr:dehydrogenase/reductase SDR family member 13-like [Pantherophis guttatus]